MYRRAMVSLVLEGDPLWDDDRGEGQASADEEDEQRGGEDDASGEHAGVVVAGAAGDEVEARHGGDERPRGRAGGLDVGVVVELRVFMEISDRLPKLGGFLV